MGCGNAEVLKNSRQMRGMNPLATRQCMQNVRIVIASPSLVILNGVKNLAKDRLSEIISNRII